MATVSIIRATYEDMDLETLLAPLGGMAQYVEKDENVLLNVIPKSIQLIAGRTAREYNLRKHRKGAFWEDRYHATAVETGHHLIQCLTYIDLNMVRAGVVQHPAEWTHGGYTEIQKPKQRYGVISHLKLTELLGLEDPDQLSENHYNWVEQALSRDFNKRLKNGQRVLP